MHTKKERKMSKRNTDEDIVYSMQLRYKSDTAKRQNANFKLLK